MTLLAEVFAVIKVKVAPSLWKAIYCHVINCMRRRDQDDAWVNLLQIPSPVDSVTTILYTDSTHCSLISSYGLYAQTGFTTL